MMIIFSALVCDLVSILGLFRAASIAVGCFAQSSLSSLISKQCELAHVHAAAMPKPTGPAQPDPMRPTSVAEDEVDTVQIHGMSEDTGGFQWAR